MNESQNKSNYSTSTIVVNFILNKFMPFICVFAILIHTCGLYSFVPYIVIGFMWFACNFSFKCGGASAILDTEMYETEKFLLSESVNKKITKSTKDDKKNEHTIDI